MRSNQSNRFMLKPMCKLALGIGLCAPLFGQAQSVGKDHVETLDRYCSECHNQDDFSGGLSFDLLDTNNVLADAEKWEAVLLKLKAGMMPPQGKDRPAEAEVAALVENVETAIDTAWEQSPNIGAPVLHRMNRTEYQNAIRDLLDLPINATALFPADASSEGFDNIADVLTVSPALMQAYISAASKVSALAVGDMTTSQGATTYRADAQNQAGHLEGITLGTRGGVSAEHVFPLDAEYEFQIGRSGGASAFVLTPVGLKDPVEIVIDGERVALLPAGAPPRITLSVAAGPHKIEAAFVPVEAPRGVDDLHNVWAESSSVNNVIIKGPLNATGPGNTVRLRVLRTKKPARARFSAISPIVHTAAP
jgi:hypothetical protein